MSPDEPPEPVTVLARIEILRYFTEAGEDQIGVSALDNGGDQLALVDALGLLELAKDTCIRVAMAYDDDEDGER